ncbi:MAG: class I SAM-dependent methyltransferase [Gammaproteobacteria bacterium]|nr:class I SAM-dependent methyltransferase [Gammaproteobacteria bacterium]
MKTNMKKEQRERIIKRHRHSVWMHGHSPRALYWENKDVQQIRFDVLLGCGVRKGDSVLDVGCGFADLYDYMKEKGIEVDYTGIDLSPDMIEASKNRLPELTFFEGDLFDFDPPEKSYDWVLLSGALNEPLQDDGEYLESIISRLYLCCRKGLAFNLLNDDYEWSARERYTLQAFKPESVMQQLNVFSGCTVVRTDYMDVDASFFAWREKKYKP